MVCYSFQAEDSIRDLYVTGVQTCALPIYQRVGLLGAGLLQAERMRSTHRLVKLLRIGAAIIHHYRGRSGAAADHKQDLMRNKIGRASCREIVKEMSQAHADAWYSVLETIW